jgi:enamine deaminase RidA (YjgF/YER057c/UK114 family)
MRDSASTGGDTSPVERRRIASGSPFEKTVGFCRAIQVGRDIHVAGTAPIMPDGGDPPEGAYAQTRRCLEIILSALAELGAGPEHVVRTRLFLVDAADIDEVGRAHGEVFGDARPVTTGVIVELLDPRWRIEIEAQAILDA